jgi:hypothetical protein
MKCYEVYLDHPNEVSDSWLVEVKSSLFEKWTTTTNHRPGASYGTWACEIANACRTCNEHLSLPCSLLAEANDVAGFLGSSCFSDDPAAFFRLYLLLLSEFTSQLEAAAQLMQLPIGKKPRQIALWANRWAKHRIQILLQHHPLMVFADAYGDRWQVAEDRFRTQPLVDACGNRYSVRVIDTTWLEIHFGGSNSGDANGPGRALVFVPPMVTFLDEAIAYFRRFIDECLKDPARIRQFESSAYLRCG